MVTVLLRDHEPKYAPYSFETFVVCAGSRAAFSAAVAVADDPGGTSNPLLLYGPIGCGKSHLLQAIAQRMRARRAGSRILRISAAELARRLAEAIRSDEVDAFRQPLSNLEALLLDDVDRLTDRPAAAREIFSVAEGLVARGAQLVFTSNGSPTGIPFAMAEKIGFPDFRARVEIARRIVADRQLSVLGAVLRDIVRRTAGNPRRIHGLIARMVVEAAIGTASGRLLGAFEAP